MGFSSFAVICGNGWGAGIGFARASLTSRALSSCISKGVLARATDCCDTTELVTAVSATPMPPTNVAATARYMTTLKTELRLFIIPSDTDVRDITGELVHKFREVDKI